MKPEEIEKLTEKLRKEINKIRGEGGASDIPSGAPEKAEPKEPLFNKKGKVSTRGMVKVSKLIGVEISADKDIYVPKSLQKKDSDWHEEVQPFIPSKMDNNGVNTDMLLAILRAWMFKKPIQISGPPGASKDYTIQWLCSLLRIPYYMDVGQEGKEPYDIVGGFIPQGDGTYMHTKTPLVLLVEHGGIYVDSEPYVNSPSVNMCKQRLTDSDRILYLMGCPDPARTTIKAHDDFCYFVTTNVRGTGDGIDKHAATTVQDLSSLNRIKIFFSADYLSPRQEQAILSKSFPSLSNRLTGKMIQLGNIIRQGWKMGKIEIPWSIRQLLEWGESCEYYGDPVVGFKQCYFNVLNEIEQDHVRQHWRDVDFDEFKL